MNRPPLLNITYSQDLQQLANALVEECFFSDANPFLKRMIIVPHGIMKDYLMQRFLDHPKLQMVGGVSILPLHQAVVEIADGAESFQSEIIPHFFELVLSIQDKLKNTTGFAKEIAKKFIDCGVYGVEELEEWQKKLWEELFPPFSYPIAFIKKRLSLSFQGQVYLFGFSDVPPLYLDFFARLKASCYFFSPCALFWSEGTMHPLLDRFGKVGKQFVKALDGFHAIDTECYDHNSSCLLGQLQRSILFSEKECFSKDDSIKIYSAATKLNEVTQLKEILIESQVKPEDVLVVVSDMKGYLPFIEAVFSESGFPFRIEGQKADSEESVVIDLLQLEENRYSLESVMGIVRSEAFQRKWNISKPESDELFDLFQEAAIRYDLQGHPNSWQAGIDRLLYGLILVPKEADPHTYWPISAVSHSQIDLLNRFLRWFSLVQPYEKKRSASEWIDLIVNIASDHFDFDLKELKKRCAFLKEPIFSLQDVLPLVKEAVGKIKRVPGWDRTLFISAETLHIPEAKIIFCLGADEEKFPKAEADEQRYLFIEMIMKAKERLIFSYERIDPLDGKEKRMSRALQELEEYIGCDLLSFCPATYSHESKKTPFFVKTAVAPQWDISIADLKKCGRSPLQLYFNCTLGVYLSYDTAPSPLCLSALDRFIVRKMGLQEQVARGVLPEGKWKEIAIAEFEEYTANRVLFVKNLREPMGTLYPALRVGPYSIEGVLEHVTPKGFAVEKKDLMKLFPLYLIYLHLYPNQPYEGVEIADPSHALLEYLRFYEKARSCCYPVTAGSLKYVLKNDSVGFLEACKDAEDPYLHYLYRRVREEELLALFQKCQEEPVWNLMS
ncbi:MAG: exodeoxyribonuclease gamma chain [Chlamydiota bacterium]